MAEASRNTQNEHDQEKYRYPWLALEYGKKKGIGRTRMIRHD
jgi:hypothetical protein